MKPNLTNEEILDIANYLHLHIQFYNSKGEPDNCAIIDKIESALKEFQFTDETQPD